MKSQPIDADMIEFVRNALDGERSFGSQTSKSYPFRNRYHHCLRVSRLAYEIAAAEKRDVYVATVAGLLHDVEKPNSNNHAEAGAIRAGQYLTERGIAEDRIAAIVDCIRFHSKSIPIENGSFRDELAVLKDADLLDEVGASGVVYTLLGKTLDDTPSSYYDALENLRFRHQNEKAASRHAKMFTETGRRIMAKRIERELEFIALLESELQGGDLIAIRDEIG